MLPGHSTNTIGDGSYRLLTGAAGGRSCISRVPPKCFFQYSRMLGVSAKAVGTRVDTLSFRVGKTMPQGRLVETAWELGVSSSLLTVNHDQETQALFVIDPLRRRRPITGARTALSGYQKGHCFYCFDGFSLLGPTRPDIDHFFPHSLKSLGFKGIDCVWNLVLSCPRCNRGSNGKSNRVPSLRLLERLNTRNEFLIESHHPLRETLMVQTGANATMRREFLNTFHQRALGALLHKWESAEIAEALF